MSWLILIVSIASIPLAGEMARERARSRKAWLWIAALVGPLAPLALLILGEARTSRAGRLGYSLKPRFRAVACSAE